MVWTSPPRTWIALEVPTNGQFNTEFRDNPNVTMPALVTTKGDTVIATAVNAAARLAVGANREILVGNSGASTGWEWGQQPAPPGMLGLFAAACPTGWTEYTTARGFALVGVPLSGTLEGTLGSALTNLQDKTHTHTGPSHNHSVTTLLDVDDESGSGALHPNPPHLTDNGGTGATGTSPMSDMMSYIQLRICEKD